MRYLTILFLLFCINTNAQKAWNYHVIDNNGSGADGVKFADVNNDGLFDIVTAWEESGSTKVYIQPEATGLKKNWPCIVLGETPNVEDAVFADMTNNGVMDVVSCTENHSQKIYIHFNPGKKLLTKESWEQIILPASEDRMSWMYAEPMNIDGKHGTDLIAAGKGKNAALGWFEAPQDANDHTAWKWHEISKVGWIMSILKEDMDKDGDLDILISDRTGELRGCRWLENPGDGGLQKHAWKNHFVGAMDQEVMFICTADLNGDNNNEILVSERTNNTIIIYSNGDGKWNSQSIQLPAFTGKAKSVQVGDIDLDGTMDIVVSTNTLKAKKNGLIYLNGKYIDAPKEYYWRCISGVHKAKYDKVELRDVDCDGDLDVLICEENYGTDSKGLGVVWYENPQIIKKTE